MKKLKMQTPDITEQNIEQIAKLFPNVLTETKDEAGNPKKAIDFDLLKQNLSAVLVDDEDERYRLDWPGKKASLLKANMPITQTLRPCREESVNFDTTENIYIEGDNFEVLKILQESYLGKIKMIYIDPPYNTGKDFIYRDNFKVSKEEYEEEIGVTDEDGDKLFKNTDSNGRFHSDWLSMMYERLVISRDLLKDDGVIFISIDDGEVANIRKLCDEIYGEENFLANIVWEKVHTRKNSSKYFSISHDHIIAYSKNKINWDRHLIPRDNTDAYKNPDNDPKGDWKPDPITAHNYYSADYIITKPNGVELKRPQDRYWVYSEESWKKKIENNEVVWGAADAYPMVKRYLSNVQNGLVPITIFSRKFAGDTSMAKGQLSSLLGLGSLFDYPKPTLLIERLQQISTSSNDIVLDFFSGSSTTAHAVMQLNAEDGGNRKFIMVQLPEPCDKKSEAYKAGYKTIADIGKERIRRAGKKILEELTTKHTKNTKEEKQNLFSEADKENFRDVRVFRGSKDLDIGFRVYKTASTNMKDVYYHPEKLGQKDLFDLIGNIKEDRTPDDLLTQVILDLGLELNLPIEKKEIFGNTVFIVQTNALVACFDDKINFKIVDEIADLKPLKVVFKDASFKDDKDRINVEERFKRLSPETVITVL